MLHVRLARAFAVPLALLACGGDDTAPLPVLGSSSSGGSSSGDVNTGQCDLSGDSACSTCTASQCLSQAKACFCPPYLGIDNCHAYQAAQLECPEDDDAGACAAALETRFPQGSAAAQGYDACQSQHCKSECGL